MTGCCFLWLDDAGVDEDINSKLQTQVSARGAVGKESKLPSNDILIPSLTSSRSPTWQVPPQHHSITVPPYISPNHFSLASKNLTFVFFPDHYFQEPQHHFGHLWPPLAVVSKPRSTTGRIMTTIYSPSSHLTFLPSVPTYLHTC